jgi:glutamate carboxypeptidase
MKSSSFAALIALQLAIAPAAAAKLSPAEAKMAKTVDAEQTRSLALLEKLVNQNSGSLNLEGVEKVGQMMRAELEPLGFKVEWKPMTDTGRAGHLIATHVGRPDAKRLLLIAHLDTVFEPDSPFQKFTRKGDMGEGPGAGDDKGGMVVIVAALRAMQAAGTLKGANIEIHMTGDEEDSGSPIEKARADLIDAGKRSDVALDFEGLVRDKGADMGSVARRSSDSWKLIATGTASHSSGIFSAAAGDGAIYEITRIIQRFRAELPEPNLTFNVGLIAGGQQAELDAAGIRATANGKTNIIPAIAIARGDLRALSPEQIARVKEKMTRDRRRTCARHRREDQLRSRRLSADGADRRQSRVADQAQRREPRPRARRDGAARSAEARRRRHQLRRRRCRWPCGTRPAQHRRPCSRRSGRYSEHIASGHPRRHIDVTAFC